MIEEVYRGIPLYRGAMELSHDNQKRLIDELYNCFFLEDEKLHYMVIEFDKGKAKPIRRPIRSKKQFEAVAYSHLFEKFKDIYIASTIHNKIKWRMDIGSAYHILRVRADLSKVFCKMLWALSSQ